MIGLPKVVVSYNFRTLCRARNGVNAFLSGILGEVAVVCCGNHIAVGSDKS